jgi:hypothetical protein
MAFGKHPERTIVVALGETRPFSDILGRHIVDLTSPTWRHELADRLRNAKCEVKTENRRKWLAEGNFDAANSHPDLTNTPSPANPDSVRRQPRSMSPICIIRGYPTMSRSNCKAPVSPQIRSSQTVVLST